MNTSSVRLSSVTWERTTLERNQECQKNDAQPPIIGWPTFLLLACFQRTSSALALFFNASPSIYQLFYSVLSSSAFVQSFIFLHYWTRTMITDTGTKRVRERETHTPAPTPTPTPTDNACTNRCLCLHKRSRSHFLFIHLELKGMIYTDPPGCFPFLSSQGNNYISSTVMTAM